MSRTFGAAFLVFSYVCVTGSFAIAANETTEPSLTIKSGSKTRTFSRHELLHSKQVVSLSLKKDVAYRQQNMTYSAVPVASLFKDLDITPTSTLIFRSLDGFSAPISAARLLNTDPKKAMAYLAIEPSAGAWPVVKAATSNQSAGPFYVVWQNPEASNIGNEEWPYQVVEFEIEPPIEKLFPRVVPASTVPRESPIRRGFASFQKNCFACHTLNGQGAAQMGPDLNIPHNPTEYLRDGFLEKLIRNPQNLRKWPKSEMAAFSKEKLSDAELRDLIAYLKHMAKTKSSRASTSP